MPTLSKTSRIMRAVFLAIFAVVDAVVCWYLLEHYYFAVAWCFCAVCVGVAAWLFHGELQAEIREADDRKRNKG